MSALGHQSFANRCNAFWLKAGEPISIQTPLNVVDNIVTPTKSVQVSASGNTGSVRFSGFPLVTNPVSMNLNQGATQPLNSVTFNVGNVSPVLTLRTSNVETDKLLLVSDSLSGTSMVLDSALGKISNSTGVLELQNIFTINTGFDATILTTSNNSNIQSPNDITFYTTGAKIGGIAKSGTAVVLGAGSNFPTSNAVLIDSNNITQIRNTLRVLDPVTSGNYINFSNAAGGGYIDLITSGSNLYPQIQFGSNATSLPRETIIFGSTSTAGVSAYIQNGNLIGLTDPSRRVYQYLDTGSDQWVFNTEPTSTNIPVTAMIVNTNGVVNFPQGINISNSSLTLQSITTSNTPQSSVGGVTMSNSYLGANYIKSTSNVWSGFDDSNLRIINRVYVASAPNQVQSLLGYSNINPAVQRPDLFNNFTWFKLWFPSEFVIDAGASALFFKITAYDGTSNIDVWNSNVSLGGGATVFVRNGPITYWNFPSSNVTGAGSTYGFGQNYPIIVHKSLFPIALTGYIADPPNAQNNYRVYNGGAGAGAGSPNNDIPIVLEGWY